MMMTSFQCRLANEEAIAWKNVGLVRKSPLAGLSTNEIACGANVYYDTELIEMSERG